MKKIICIICFILISFSSSTQAAQIEPVKVAFSRDGYMWLKINGKEEKITKEKAQYPYPPQWSYDGKWILYLKEVSKTMSPCNPTEMELWIYNLETKKHKKIFYDAENPKWAPNRNIVAFQSRGVLNISDLNRFYNIALGVDDYNWYPDGKAFIASSSASLRPDGWTNPVLYKIPIGDQFEKVNLTGNAKPLFVVPKELSKGSNTILSINAGDFEFSPDGKWISFMVSPTASLAMDSDMLAVIRSDGKDFEVIDEIIWTIDEPKWAFSKNWLGYISGGGRIVFGFKNKDLKITELPAFKTTELTPLHYAEMGFTWVGDDGLIVSRVKESEWSNDPKKRPKASLVSINLLDQTQTKITTPGIGLSDNDPKYIKAINKIIWLRQKETDHKGDLWIADLDGENASVWIKNVGGYDIYPKD